MDLEDGVGLAAPQVGVRKRLFTFDLHEGEGPGVVDQPRDRRAPRARCSPTRAASRSPATASRSCGPSGSPCVASTSTATRSCSKATSCLARMIQHEIDHLDGVLLLDRVEPDVRREALRDMRTRELTGRTEPIAALRSRPRLCSRSIGATGLLRHARRRGPGARRAARRRARDPARGHPTRPSARARQRAEPEPGEGGRGGAGASGAHPREVAVRSSTRSPRPAPRSGVVVAFGQLLAAGAARRGAARVRERALLAAAAVAGRGAGRAGDARGRHRDRRVHHGAGGRARHRAGVRARASHRSARTRPRASCVPGWSRSAPSCWSTTLPPVPTATPRTAGGRSPPTPTSSRSRSSSSTGSVPAEDLARIVRAGNPRPGAWTTDHGSGSRSGGPVRCRPASTPPGTVFGHTRVATGDGALELVEVQPEGRRVMHANAWLAGRGRRPARY